ncbi:MAG: TlpA family protein disulfide reductase [Actinobacteria bacterium]|nr:TlpA family protein disulfide reductase [Actinomycetota bacterium]
MPKPIADNVAQANQLVDTSIDAKLASLRGVPVVVNQWASWCPNCRAEFPLFARLAKHYRHQVAFLGVDSQDSRGDAQDFLKRFRVDYPSIFDQSAAQAQSIGAGQAWPTTLFFDASGHLRHLRPGGYATLASLDADIRRYALPG